MWFTQYHNYWEERKSFTYTMKNIIKIYCFLKRATKGNILWCNQPIFLSCYIICCSVHDISDIKAGRIKRAKAELLELITAVMKMHFTGANIVLLSLVASVVSRAQQGVSISKEGGLFFLLIPWFCLLIVLEYFHPNLKYWPSFNFATKFICCMIFKKKHL